LPKKINSGALEPLNKAFGLTGAGSRETVLLDGSLDQVIDTVPIARRGGTLAGSQGMFSMQLQTVHAGAGNLQVDINPYAVGTTGQSAPFPAAVPAGIDLWLISAQVARRAGADTPTATLIMRQQPGGFGIDDSGAAVALDQEIMLASWDGIATTGASTRMTETGTGKLFAEIGLRIPRNPAAAGQDLSFRSSAAAVAVTLDCILLFGYFPSALGQDVKI